MRLRQPGLRCVMDLYYDNSYRFEFSRCLTHHTSKKNCIAVSPRSALPSFYKPLFGPAPQISSTTACPDMYFVALAVLIHAAAIYGKSYYRVAPNFQELHTVYVRFVAGY